MSLSNRLAKETSPYLLQHATNPVAWYAWGEEAFAAAKAQDKPIFLSIGYATCHWCHVMAHESFENEAVAALLNENFINIKVDREEHPEVDSVYMDFAQALMSASGGWPLNLFLTPDLKPFFAVTYLPPHASRGLIGLIELIPHIQEVWKGEERAIITQKAEELFELFAHTSNATGHDLPRHLLITKGAEAFFETADGVNGGLKGEPKFPLSYQSEFLLHFARHGKDPRGFYFSRLTLEMMSRGGIYDHLGGGFSRYAVDEEWLVPHFEKMLYDNAILAKTYLEAWKDSKLEEYEETCRQTLDYILREMTHSNGAFYAAEDADTEAQEGFYYTWTLEEIESSLPKELAELFCSFYDVSALGNYKGRNILNRGLSLQEYSKALGLPQKSVSEKLKKAREILLKEREKRPKPFKDDKILTSWNGLMIDTFIRAGSALQEEKYTHAALLAARFIHDNLYKEGRLFHSWRAGIAKVEGILDDYVFLIKGLLSLYEEGQGREWLEWAESLTAYIATEFKEMEGAFYQTTGNDPLILRKCEFYDGPEPSGNAVHTENLLRLYQITKKEHYLNQAEDVIKAAKSVIESLPVAACYHLIALSRYLDSEAPTVTIMLDHKERHKKEIQRALASHYAPHLTVVWSEMEAPLTTFSLCRGTTCFAPLTKLEEILKVVETI